MLSIYCMCIYSLCVYIYAVLDLRIKTRRELICRLIQQQLFWYFYLAPLLHFCYQAEQSFFISNFKSQVCYQVSHIFGEKPNKLTTISNWKKSKIQYWAVIWTHLSIHRYFLFFLSWKNNMQKELYWGFCLFVLFLTSSPKDNFISLCPHPMTLAGESCNNTWE